MCMRAYICVYRPHNELLSVPFSYEDGDQHPKAKQSTQIDKLILALDKACTSKSVLQAAALHLRCLFFNQGLSGFLTTTGEITL